MFILGEKKRMTQMFDDEGRAHGVTVLRVEPNVVTQVKTVDTDGYQAIQLGYGSQKPHRVAKPQQGHMKHVAESREDSTLCKTMREFRITGDNELSLGDTLDVTTFAVGDVVNVSAQTKGKGFQGGVKRHGFSGGPRTHGQKHGERSVGSVGAAGPARIFPGQRMPGRMGNDRVTVKKLKVMHIDADRNEMYVKGAIPGRPGALVEVVRTKAAQPQEA